jgi:hypothetical protein
MIALDILKLHLTAAGLREEQADAQSKLMNRAYNEAIDDIARAARTVPGQSKHLQFVEEFARQFKKQVR